MSPLLHPMSCMGCHSPGGRGLAGEVPPGVTVKHQEGQGHRPGRKTQTPLPVSPPPHFGGAAAAPGWACNSCLFIQFYSAEIEFVFQFFPDSIKGHQLHCKSNLSFAMYSLNPS